MSRILTLPELPSTNSYVEANARSLEDMTLVRAVAQTAGKGQRGNSWEAEPGMNLTVSLFKRHDGFPANRQFLLSEATALAVVDLLDFCGVCGAEVKWPNDIYVGQRKICGILIKHSLAGPSLDWSVIGIGINVNQTRFLSDAPNPVSIAQLTGRRLDLEPLLPRLVDRLAARFAQALSDPDALHAAFKNALWRREGEHPYLDTATGESFRAAVSDIALDGILTLRDTSGALRRYAFKEVQFLPEPE